jgi:hypothetical protein
MPGRGFRRNSRVVWPGFSNVTAPRSVVKVGRNEPCPCGNGKKFKDCHEKEGAAYLERLALERDRARIRAERQRLKELGVPWYKRLLMLR